MSAALRAVDPPPGAERVGAATFILSLRARGIFDLGVLRAMETVPRELFAPRRYADLARSDVALPLPSGQTMSAPATVAAMLAALEVRAGSHVLEIGTGSGYVAAVLARMGAFVHTFECRPILADSAGQRLAAGGFAHAVAVTCSDGLADRPGDDRYDRILLNGTLPHPPASLTSRLRAGGRLVCALASRGGTRIATIVRAEDGRLTQAMGGPVRISPLLAENAGSAVSANGHLT